jgi:hypothetical protein
VAAFLCSVHVTNRWAGLRAWVKFGFAFRSGRAPRSSFGPAGRRVGSFSECPSARLAFLSRVGRRRLRPVLKHGPRSLTCVRVIGLTKLKGAVKAKAVQQLRDDPLDGRSPGASHRPRFVGSSKSIHVGTRKMVNYAWPG